MREERQDRLLRIRRSHVVPGGVPRIGGALSNLRAMMKGEGEGSYDAQQSRDATGGIRIAPDPVNTYRAEVEAFARAVIEDTDPPVGGEAGRWNQRVLAAAYESAGAGKAVTV